METKDTEIQPPPLHMDKYTRNQRLYETLVGMGLYCQPVYGPGLQIEALYVSAELPSETAAVRCVTFPVTGPQVGQGVTSSSRRGSNVVDFPPIS